VARRPWGLAFGPDGNLYVANLTGSDAIIRVQGPFNVNAGSFSTFTGAGAFFDVAFGPDGNLYASGRGAVMRFDIVTGDSLGDFTHGHTLAEVHAIAFGSDGLLYVTNYDSCVSGPNGCTGSHSEIVRFDAVTGEFIDLFADNIPLPWDLAFGPGGSLYVATGTNVIRFDRFTGKLRAVRTPGPTVFASREGLAPLALAFGPDGNLYVSNSDGSGSAGSILRFDGKTGAFIDVFVPAVEGGPRGIAFSPGVN
jgi:DNA-binding beta-propeller fold protein YncE